MLGDGNQFGKSDDNIKKGLTVESACKDMIKAIYAKRFWITLGAFKYFAVPLLVNLSENLYLFYLKIQMKS